MRITKILLVVLFAGSLFVPVQPVHADMAPPPEVELGGLQPPQFQHTEVAMLYERVEMELGVFNDYESRDVTQNRVTVNAYFMMENQGSIDETMQAVFPLESAPICHGDTHGDSFTVYDILPDSFQVSINGIAVPTTIITAPYGECTDFHWLAFDIVFPVEKEVLVKISYEMRTLNVDAAQNIEYTLETGAGWKGKIGRGYIILKFPYVVTSENVLRSSTVGYQVLYNEIFWSFQDLEPTAENNIQISIVSPNIWMEIQSLRSQIDKMPESPAIWLKLIEIYNRIAYSNKGITIRDQRYTNLIETTYQQAITANPNNAELHAGYAAHKLFSWSPYGQRITDGQARQVLPLLSKALALEPRNETALYVLSRLNVSAPFITFTPPSTIPPTATSLFTSTPSITPSATITPIPSETPIVVTVIHTKIVNAPTFTQMPKPTATFVPTEIDIPDGTQKQSDSSTKIFGALLVFAVGAGSGWLLSKRQKK